MIEGRPLERIVETRNAAATQALAAALAVVARPGDLISPRRRSRCTMGLGPDDQLGQENEPGTGGPSRREQAAHARESAERWIGQLQDMIDQAGRQAAPVLREVAAKAAELAAVAAEHAGPAAHKAANVTEHVGAHS